MGIKRGKFSYFFNKNHKGQTTIFIILAIMLVGGVALFFALRQNLSLKNIPVSIQPAYDSFLSCVEDKALMGVSLLQSQGGYIELPEFKAGSEYSPFSSYLYFLGSPIPYWYYLSATNLPKQQIPSKTKMQTELANFISQETQKCDFSNYYSQGFEITQKPGKAQVQIEDNRVKINLNLDLEISKGEDKTIISSHNVELKSKLGSLYDSAIKIYEKENQNFFLENYSIDVLRLYAPVDGVILSCSPKIWNAYDIYGDLQQAIETNLLAIKTENPDQKSEKYFYQDFDIENEARFLYFSDWPFYLEVLPSEDSFLISKPVGNQAGLGVLGFCYAPYHFVYDIKYPVLVQVYSGEEIFQFPLAVVIENNLPRKTANDSSSVVGKQKEICLNNNMNISVKTYDYNLNEINSEISYECFNELCEIGNTTSETLKFPPCVNGVVIAKSEGFKEERQIYSTNQGGNIEMVLKPLHELDLNLNIQGIDYQGEAIIEFSSDQDSNIVYYPQQDKINLSEGNYEISVSIYKDASINFKQTTQEICVEIPSSGLGVLFGAKDKQCSNVTMPAQLISKALAGGGKQSSYLFEEDLINSKSLELTIDPLSVPASIEDLQNMYTIINNKEVGVTLI